jgi:hypothetical protein
MAPFFTSVANSVLSMQENQLLKQDYGANFDLQSVLPIQFDSKGRRMTVRPRIDGPEVEKVALRFMDEAVDLRQPDELLFDLADQATITSSVLGAFVKYHRRGIKVHLLDPSKPILDALTHTQLHKFFHVRHRSRE